MRTFSPLKLLAALGALSLVTGQALAAVDTSEWKCETCPFDKAGVSGTVDVGVGDVSDKSAKFGDYNGLDRKGAYVSGGADVRYGGANGFYGLVKADSTVGAIKADLGHEGQYALRLGYQRTPHSLIDDALTPFQGVGSSTLTLPAGFRASTTGAMPLATTLQSVDVGITRSRFDASISFDMGERWTNRLSVRRDVRDGLQRMAGSFFATSTQLLAPVDQVTNQIEVSTNYIAPKMQASLAYQISNFRNENTSLTWANPFSENANNTARGQMALAPDNQFHQLIGTASYQVMSNLRASGDVAIGRLTQDVGYLAATLNSSLQPGALPETSLHGKVETFTGNGRVVFNATDRIRLNASYSRDVRDNRTGQDLYPSVAADMFLGAPRLNQPFIFKQDRYKLSGDYRGSDGLRFSVGAEENEIERARQDVVNTRDTTAWARVGLRVGKDISVSIKASHSERSNSGYGTATWVTPAESPWMRKFNLADRNRDSASVRVDTNLAEGIALGVHASSSEDRYSNTTVGLKDGRSNSYGFDLSAALSDETQLRGFAQQEDIRSTQGGSSVASQADWWVRNSDKVEVYGVGLKHSAMKGKLELGADFTHTRSHSDVSVDPGFSVPQFPTNSTSMDSLKLQGTYRLQDNMWLTAGLQYEEYKSRDWALDGILPATVANLLTVGAQAPQYRVYLLRLGMRYRF